MSTHREQLEPALIAVPVKVKLERFCYGHLHGGPLYLYYASVAGIESVPADCEQPALRDLERKLMRHIDEASSGKIIPQREP